MAEGIRILGLMSSAFAIGILLVLAFRPPGTTGFQVPWRYWGVAAGMLIEISGVTARISLWNQPLNPRDITFLAINICIIVAAFGTLTQQPKGAP